MDRLNEIKIRLAAATPGPWELSTIQPDAVISKDTVALEMLRPDIRQKELGWYGGAFVGESLSPNDRDLVAHAPADLAYLLGIAEAALVIADSREAFNYTGRGVPDSILRLREAIDRVVS
jgi:hypothetical protein